MNNEIGTVEDLIRYRLEKSRKDLSDANALIDRGSFDGANNRIYYAVFHAIAAIHAFDGTPTKSHQHTIGEFNRKYIKTKIFDSSYGKTINAIQNARRASDYDDFTEENPIETLHNRDFAQKFYREVKKYCESRLDVELGSQAIDINRKP